MRKYLFIMVLSLFTCTNNSISQNKDITYTDLLMSYYENGISFKNNYLYQDLIISGTVAKIDRTANDVACVAMVLQNVMFLFYFDKENEAPLSSISAFEWVKIKGRLYMADIFQGSMTFVFRNCILIKNPTSIDKEEDATDKLTMGNYIDKKHHFIFKYPREQFSFLKSESSIEDTTFLSGTSGAKVVLTVVDMLETLSLKDYYEDELNRQPEATYKVINTKKSFFVVSSIIDNRVIYLRAKQSGKIIIKYRVSYSVDDKAYYDPMLKEISVNITK